jgi:antitoxin PrlF
MHFEATVTSKGQITIPAQLRAHLKLKDGDKVEFYADHGGRIMMRPRNRSATEFLDALEPRVPDPSIGSDDEAIAQAIAERDARSRRRKAKAE